MSRTQVETTIHPQAIVDPGAELGTGVVVGPWTFVGPGVRVGDGTSIGPGVLIERDTDIGSGCVLHKGAVLGSAPQDLKYHGEETRLRVGDRTVVREYATLKAMGYAGGYLAGAVGLQATILALAGSLPGVAVSWWLHRFAASATSVRSFSARARLCAARARNSSLSVAIFDSRRGADISSSPLTGEDSAAWQLAA